MMDPTRSQFFNNSNRTTDSKLTKQRAVNLLREGITFANNFSKGNTTAVETFQDDRYSLPTKSKPQPSSVLVVLRYAARSDINSNCWDVLLTLRPSHMRFHGGLVCLPGGKLENGEDTVNGALREAKEEVNLSADDIEVIGELESTVTLGGIFVTPVISVTRHDNIALCRNPVEVEDIFWMPLSEFLRSENHREVDFVLAGEVNIHMRLHYFDYSPPGMRDIYTVWGLTGRVLMLTAGIAFHLLPEYVIPQKSGYTQDPLLLGYIPPIAKL